MAGLMALVGLSVVLLSPSMGNPLAAQPQPAPAAQELHHAGEVVEEQGEQGEEEASLPLRDEDEEAALPQRDEDEGAPLLPRRAQVGGYKTYDGDRRQAAPPPALDVELEETQQDVPVVQVNTDYRSLVPRRQFKKMASFFFTLSLSSPSLVSRKSNMHIPLCRCSSSSVACAPR